jgi:hypothetical protein
MAENRIENSKITKSATMKSDVADTKNVFLKSEAEAVEQDIRSQEEGLSLWGFGKAKGRRDYCELQGLRVLWSLKGKGAP